MLHFSKAIEKAIKINLIACGVALEINTIIERDCP
jgi:hypothetical protein